MPLLKATYINHVGRRIEFGTEDGLFLNQHDLFNFNWNVQMRGNKIISVNRMGVREHKIPLVIVAETKEKACKFANDLYSICESDLIANKKGTLIVNGYNLDCFVRGQDYTEWSDLSKCLKISATVIRDGLWYKILQPITFIGDDATYPIGETVTNNGASPSAAQNNPWTGGDKGYYYDYPYDYLGVTITNTFENNTDVSLSWKAVIYGPTSTTGFTIGGHDYYVDDVELGNGERLEITAKQSLDEKTVFMFDGSGNKTNYFANRRRSSYLFEPIPPGEHVVSYGNDLTWKLIPILERSSPEWL